MSMDSFACAATPSLCLALQATVGTRFFLRRCRLSLRSVHGSKQEMNGRFVGALLLCRSKSGSASSCLPVLINARARSTRACINSGHNSTALFKWVSASPGSPFASRIELPSFQWAVQLFGSWARPASNSVRAESHLPSDQKALAI